MTLLRARAQSVSSFGSKTTHWVPNWIDCSTKMKSRRTLIYFQSGSGLVVRPPQTKLPYPLKKRRQLTPLGFRIACC